MWDEVLNEALGQPNITEKSKEIFQNQVIDEHQPGTILRDFTTLVEFIGADGLKTTGKYFMLPQGRLNELNERMSRPIQHRLKRPQQRSFPHLHGLFMILRASGIGISKGVPPSGRLAIDEAMVAQWLDMNPTERYFTLLETWLLQASGEIVGERSGWMNGRIGDVIDVSRDIRLAYPRSRTQRYGGALVTMMDPVTLALMEIFGWIQLEYQKPKAGGAVKPAAIERLPLGEAMMEIIHQYSLLYGFVSASRNAQAGALQPLFQPYFPEWRRHLVLPEEPFREGAHTWRVSLGKPWRRIVTPADLDLDDLALAILDAFNFDDDHLYCFELLDRCGRALRIACGYDTEAQACTEDVRLGDVPLSVGGTMTFLFDYGDEWEFDVELENVDTKKSRLKHPKLIAKGGKAPRQYDYEEDDDW